MYLGITTTRLRNIPLLKNGIGKNETFTKNGIKIFIEIV